MKANGVLEKIYVSNYSSGLTYNWHNEQLAVNNIEYVRKDAFIEKACEFLFENYHGEKLSLRMIEEFRNYMKGE